MSEVIFPVFQIRPHHKAPLFKDVESSQVVMQQLISEITSQNFNTNTEIREYLRQAGMVNLFFYLRFIAGHSGPYDKLNMHLHLDMCNFRQSDLCMGNGAHSAAFIPRSCFKSTVFTHGANGWELLRNPDLRIGLVNAVFDKAMEFKRTTQRTFDNNALFAWLYPEYVPKGGASRWNEKEMVLPNRTRDFTEPSIKVMGATGAAEGSHHDLLNLDDLVGLDDLGSERGANQNMQQKINWFKTNTKALLVDWKRSRIMLVATRYAVGDVYQQVCDNANTVSGYENPNITIREKGKWNIYYRCIKENDNIIFPENFTEEGLEEIIESDFWTYVTQYANNPQETGMTEFYSCDTKDCEIVCDGDRWFILTFPNDNFPEEKRRKIPLAACDVVMALDPAATDKQSNPKTCRSSLGIWAMDVEGNVYRIWERVGFYSLNDIFDQIFEGHKLFKGYIRKTVFEKNAFQKVIKGLLTTEMEKRDYYFYCDGVQNNSDKIVRIRNVLGTRLMKQKVYLGRGCSINFIEEKNVFPMNKYRVDVLDESSIALSDLVKPLTEEQVVEYEEQEVDYLRNVSDNAVGY